jgi:hypothetical protein
MAQFAGDGLSEKQHGQGTQRDKKKKKNPNGTVITQIKRKVKKFKMINYRETRHPHIGSSGMATREANG